MCAAKMAKRGRHSSDREPYARSMKKQKGARELWEEMVVWLICVRGAG
jgi:hypothetical protein